MSAMAFKITSVSIVCSTICVGPVRNKKHQSCVPLAFVWGIHRSPVNFPHKGSVTRNCFHLMTSSWKYVFIYLLSVQNFHINVRYLWYYQKLGDFKLTIEYSNSVQCMLMPRRLASPRHLQEWSPKPRISLFNISALKNLHRLGLRE